MKLEFNYKDYSNIQKAWEKLKSQYNTVSLYGKKGDWKTLILECK